MEGNKIYFKDLFDPDVLEGLARMKETLGNVSGSLNGLGEAVKAEASKVQSMMSAGNQSTEALAKLASTLERLCDIFDKWKAATDANKEAIEALKTSTKAQVEIDKEFCSTEKTKQALIQTETALLRKKEVADRIAAASAKKHAAEQKNADTELKKYTESLKKLNSTSTEFVSINGVMSSSFKELSAAYSATVAKMKDMILAGDTDNDTFKKLSTSAMLMHEKLDSINRSIGIYTMNVGNYKTAFDGLGFSLQQIIREAPSAINLQQFFLAISNNIPLFLDQVARVRREIPKINKDIDILTKKRAAFEALKGSVSETSDEFKDAEINIEALSKQIDSLGNKQSVTKSIVKSIFSWQTAVIVGLYVLTNYKKVLETIKTVWGKIRGVVKAVTNEISLGVAKGKMYAKVLQDVSRTRVELNLLVSQLEKATSGTMEWKNAIARVNEITGSNLDSTTATIDAVKKVTEEYKKQALQLAINQQIVDSQAADMVNRSKRNRIFNNPNMGIESIVNTLGLTDQKQIDEVTQAYDKYKNALDIVTKLRADLVKYEKNGTEVQVRAVKNSLYSRNGWESVLRDETTEFQNAVRKYAPINDQATIEWQNSLYKGIPTGDNKKVSGNNSNSTSFTRQFEINRRLAETMAESYDKERKLLEISNEEKLAQEDVYYRAEIEKAKGNAKEIERINREHEAMLRVIEAENKKDKTDLDEKYAKMRINNEIELSKETLKETNIRVRTVKDEERKNEVIMSNLESLYTQKEALEKIDTENIEDGEKAKQEAIEATTAAIEKQKNALGWSKKLALPKNLGDVTGVKDFFTSKMKDNSEGVLRNALGDKMYDSLDEKQREAAFDTWLENSIDAMGTWYNTSVGYIKDVMDAYVELQQAKVEAAEEATDAAKEQYESEKALMEAGYANNMESAYKEYKEKQALQKKAEEESKRAQKAQLALDSVSQSSSLITAAAQLWQSLSAIPVVGSALAIAAISTMFGSFAGAKIMAAKATKYGDGTAQLIDYGGSHASGNDVPLGVDKNGNEERIERGEIKAVINRRAVGRLGASRIIDMINSMNDGTFVEDAVGTTRRNLSLSINSERPVVNLSNIEKSLGNIERSENEKRYIDGDFEVVKIGNYTKRIRRK